MSLGGTNYRVIEWDGDDVTDEVDITTTESGGYQELDPEGGLEKWTGSITFLAAPGSNAPAKGMANLVLYEGGQSATDGYAFKAFIGSIKHANKVNAKDPITWVASYSSSGKIGRQTATVDNPYGS